MSQAKSLKAFVEHLVETGATRNGSDDYKVVQAKAEAFFGGKLPKDAVWKCVNALPKETVDFVDDL